MWFHMISTAGAEIWAWLPQATLVLRFITALIGFCLTFSLVARRMRRRWLRRRRG
jgi:hypothetical protein